MRYLRQSTAATVIVGPLIDKADGLTPLTAVADQSANARLVKNGTGAAFTAASWAPDALGHYLVGLSTAHTDTLGTLRLSFSLPGTYCPVWEDFEVESQAAYDARTGAAGWTGVGLAADQAVNATKWAGTAIPAPAVTGVPRVDARYLVGADLSGYNADLKLKSAVVVNPTGTAVNVESALGQAVELRATSANGRALWLRSDAGAAVEISGGTGHPAVTVSGSVDGIDIGCGTGDGVSISAGSGGVAVRALTVVSDIPASVWASATRTLTSFGTLIADAAAAVWAAVTRTLTASSDPSAATIAAAVAAQAAAGADGTIGGALSQVPPGGGLRQIVIRVVDGLGNRVPNVDFAVYDSTNTGQARRGTTDPAGERGVNLDDATYKVRLACPGYSFTVPETMVVTQDDTVTFTATAFVTPTPVDPGDCVVWDWLEDLNGPLPGAKIRFRVHVPGPCGPGTGVNTWVELAADGDGLFSIEIPYGTPVEVDCRAAGYVNRVKTVPATASQQLRTWV